MPIRTLCNYFIPKHNIKHSCVLFPIFTIELLVLCKSHWFFGFFIDFSHFELFLLRVLPRFLCHILWSAFVASQVESEVYICLGCWGPSRGSNFAYDVDYRIRVPWIVKVHCCWGECRKSWSPSLHCFRESIPSSLLKFRVLLGGNVFTLKEHFRICNVRISRKRLIQMVFLLVHLEYTPFVYLLFELIFPLFHVLIKERRWRCNSPWHNGRVLLLPKRIIFS